MALAGPADDYINFIRQTQMDTGVEWDVTVASQGQSLSQEGVGPEGSNFELWSVHSPTANDFLLDEQYVSSFLPNAVVTLSSADPYQLTPRTRVDQPFTLTVSVAGLDDGTSGIDPSLIPEAAKKIGLTRSVVAYPEGTHTAVEANITPTILSESYLTANGVATVSYTITGLTGPDMTLVEGEEIFTASSLASFGAVASVLDSKRIQIWPIARGTLSGVDSTRRYATIPQIAVTMVDLYPASETYVRAYLGAPQTSPAQSFMLPGSYVLLNDSVPQDRTMVIDDIDESFEREGPYTLELIHETPFGTDILVQFYPLHVDRTIEINGALNTEGR